MNTSSYRRSLEENGYEVTPDQRATHRHILEGVIPVRKSLDSLLGDLGRYGALDLEEAEKVREALLVLDGLCIPMSLLKLVEDPQQAAASRMFSSMLRSREVSEPGDDAPALGLR